MRRAVSAASGVGERVGCPPISALRATNEFTTRHSTLQMVNYRKRQCTEQYRTQGTALRVPKRSECSFRPPRQRTASTLGATPRISRFRVRVAYHCAPGLALGRAVRSGFRGSGVFVGPPPPICVPRRAEEPLEARPLMPPCHPARPPSTRATPILFPRATCAARCNLQSAARNAASQHK